MAVCVSIRASTPSFTYSRLSRTGASAQRVSPCCCSQAVQSSAADSVGLRPPVEHISSVQNQYVKHCVKLRTSSSYRSESGRLLLAGATVIKEQFSRCSLPEIMTLFLEQQSTCSIPNHVVSSAQKVVTVERHVMKKLAGVQEAASVGAVAEVAMPKKMTDQQWQHARRVLVLDRIQDPGNLGTLLRNAEALNWSTVYLLDGCCDVYNEKALRAARGATFTVNVAKGSWEEFRVRAQDTPMLLLAADADAAASEDVTTSSARTGDLSNDPWLDPWNDSNGGAEEPLEEENRQKCAHSISDLKGIDVSDLFEQLESRKVALVLGSEGQGLRPEVLRECATVSIPMMGGSESLNVAAAGSMLMLVLSQSLEGVLRKVYGAINAR